MNIAERQSDVGIEYEQHFLWYATLYPQTPLKNLDTSLANYVRTSRAKQCTDGVHDFSYFEIKETADFWRDFYKPFGDHNWRDPEEVKRRLMPRETMREYKVGVAYEKVGATPEEIASDWHKAEYLYVKCIALTGDRARVDVFYSNEVISNCAARVAEAIESAWGYWHPSEYQSGMQAPAQATLPAQFSTEGDATIQSRLNKSGAQPGALTGSDSPQSDADDSKLERRKEDAASAVASIVSKYPENPEKWDDKTWVAYRRQALNAVIEIADIFPRRGEHWFKVVCSLDFPNDFTDYEIGKLLNIDDRRIYRQRRKFVASRRKPGESPRRRRF